MGILFEKNGNGTGNENTFLGQGGNEIENSVS